MRDPPAPSILSSVCDKVGPFRAFLSVPTWVVYFLVHGLLFFRQKLIPQVLSECRVRNVQSTSIRITYGWPLSCQTRLMLRFIRNDSYIALVLRTFTILSMEEPFM
ncbi:hypothetical protein BDV27DRAFT_14103 [Aspergillus caelatus]|uniref:Uncharacterized protein n=1 Tax=Aspergillus caelatus TaxID=61420 RepID=A0A5N7AHY9_9EURO|nr:uncharacterized protein BDV27DRAFT_14103 [Aspergillus caelatus]KAE8369293.1 hypothetical protein BDV27DRAFT_14103 [Aspergillus caelatus]